MMDRDNINKIIIIVFLDTYYLSSIIVIKPACCKSCITVAKT